MHTYKYMCIHVEKFWTDEELEAVFFIPKFLRWCFCVLVRSLTLSHVVVGCVPQLLFLLLPETRRSKIFLPD